MNTNHATGDVDAIPPDVKANFFLSNNPADTRAMVKANSERKGEVAVLVELGELPVHHQGEPGEIAGSKVARLDILSLEASQRHIIRAVRLDLLDFVLVAEVIEEADNVVQHPHRLLVRRRLQKVREVADGAEEDGGVG